MTTKLTAQTSRFGEIEYSTDAVLTFCDGLLGFPLFKSYAIIEHKEGSAFRWLQSLDEPGLAFLVVDPFVFVNTYEFEINDRDANDLKLAEDTPRVVYTIVTIPRGKPDEMTMNLAGPIVINAETRDAKQFVIEHPGFPVRHLLFPKTESNQETKTA